MKRLEYTRYVAQGGDWGALVVDHLGLQAPPGLLGIHTNMAGTVPPEVAQALKDGTPPSPSFSADERNAWDQPDFFYKYGLGYAIEVHHRPQPLHGDRGSPGGPGGLDIHPD